MTIKGLKLDVTVNASFKVDNFEAPDRKVEGFKMKDTGASASLSLEEVSTNPEEVCQLVNMVGDVLRDALKLEMEENMRKAEEAKREAEMKYEAERDERMFRHEREKAANRNNKNC